MPDASRQSVTLMAFVNAAGESVPPIIVYPRKTLPPSIRRATSRYMPFVVGHTPTGYMK